MKIFVVDDVGPENIAMVQALYSRSAESVTMHLEKVRQTGAGKFWENYVVGYNHKSIADCNATTIFIEDVSIIAAKAIQDNPLYSGQETSTRYINMSQRAIVDPIGTPTSKAILNTWMDFYNGSLDHVAKIVAQRHPQREGEAASAYDRAVKARAFDIMRGFLPAGITTQLSWTTNLRQAGDNLVRLSHHPVREVRDIAGQLTEILTTTYPSSGFQQQLAGVSGVSGGADDRHAWNAAVGANFTYPPVEWVADEPWMTSDIQIPTSALRELLRVRPRGCVLPHHLTDLGQCHLSFLLDYGAFRDIQRQRNGVCRMPMLTTEYGFHTWYLDQLESSTASMAVEASQLIAAQTARIDELDAPDHVKQFYIPLGFRVPTLLMYSLPALLYVLELRSSKTVHPTLRTEMLKIVDWFATQYPDVALHADTDLDDWTVRRGLQTITAK